MSVWTRIKGFLARGADGSALNPVVVGGLDLADLVRSLRVSDDGKIVIAARGTSGWIPDSNDFDTDEFDSLKTDVDGSLRTRAKVLTDETSFRSDFADQIPFNLTGTLSFTNGSAVVTGSGTAFVSELCKEHYIKHTSHARTAYLTVDRVIDDTHLVLSDVYSGATASGTGVASKWIPYVVNGGAISVSTSKVDLSVGIGATDEAAIDRQGDYGPFVFGFSASINNRRANQRFYAGMISYVGGVFEGTKAARALLVFDGTVNTVVKLETAWSDADVETSTFTLPGGLTTNNLIEYVLEVLPSKVVFSVNGVFVGEHRLHIPGPYSHLDLHLCMENTGAIPAGGTTASVDTCFLTNFNRVEIGSTSKGDPESVRMVEDIHTLTGTLTTSATTANQVILQYTVPANKSLWIVGFSINNGETTVRGNPVKIVRGSASNNPAASPGVVDGTVFRSWNVPASSEREADFSGMPRRFASAEEVVYVTVTPSGSTSTIWRTSLDFVLR